MSSFCAGAESCGQGSTWVVARMLDLSPKRDECCCLFFGTSVSRLPEFLLLQQRLSGLATVLSAGSKARLKFIKILLKSTEHQMKSIEIHENPLNSNGHSMNSISIYWNRTQMKSIEIHWNPWKIHWNPFKSIKIHWTSLEIPLKNDSNLSSFWKSNEIQWNPLRSV